MEAYRVCYKKCVVPGCTDIFSKKHGFPIKDDSLFNKWVQQVQNPILDNKSKEQIYKYHRVCNLHFAESDKVPGTKRGLMKAAFPTLYLPHSRNASSAVESKTNQSTTSTPSINSNIGQNDFELAVNEVHPPTAEEMLSIKQESEPFCRLCLGVSTDCNSYINILPSYGESSCRQDRVQEMIQKVIPDLDLSLTYNPGICIDCESRLSNAYDFISFSIQNQNTLLDRKYKQGDDGYVNIQDVVTTFEFKEVKDVLSKKLRTTSSNDRDELKYDATGERDITIKEEPDCEPLGSTEKSNPIVIEQSCNRLLNTSANRNNYDAPNKRLIKESKDVSSKKLKTSSNDPDEIKYDSTGECDITIKEEPLGTTEKSNPIVIEQSCNRLLNTSANRNNYDAPNKRLIRESKDVSSKKLKITSSNDRDEIKYDATGECNITIKEEPLGTTEKSNPIVIEQSCNRLLNTSANRNNYNLKHIKFSIHSMQQTNRVITEGGNRNATNKVVELKSIRPVEIITRNSTGLPNNIKAGNLKIKVLKIKPGKELLGSSKTDRQGRAAE